MSPALRLLLTALCLTLLAPAASAAGKKKPAPPARPLDLTVTAADLDLKPAPASPVGLRASLADNPWRVLEPEKEVGGIRIPQLDRDEPGTKGSEGLNQKLLVRVLDGETIPLLTIRVVPPPPPEAD